MSDARSQSGLTFLPLDANELKMQVRPCRISSITDTPDALTAHDRITFLYIDLRQMCV